MKNHKLEKKTLYNICERLGANISKDVNNFMSLWKLVWLAGKKGGYKNKHFKRNANINKHKKNV